jgi:hypothetical protein
MQMYLQKVISKNFGTKPIFLLESCQPLTKAGSGSESVSQEYGSAAPDPYLTKMSRIYNIAFNLCSKT